jgi:chorismate dehydratase
VIRVGRIPYINCFPVYKGIDKGIVALHGELVSGVPTELNRLMSDGVLDISVVSAIEYARQPERYYLLPDLAISCDGPVRSVLLLSKFPAERLQGKTLLVSRSSMTSVALLEQLFKHVWRCNPVFQPGDAELSDMHAFHDVDHAARLVIGDAALHLSASRHPEYQYGYDLGEQWKYWTGLPFVFAVWVAQRSASTAQSLAAHAALLASRDWGLANIPMLALEAERVSGVAASFCEEYLSGLDYSMSLTHLDGLTDFFRRLAKDGLIKAGNLAFLPAA